MVISVALLFGPTLGSALSQFSLSAPFFFASGAAFCGLILAFFFLPESSAVRKRMETDTSDAEVPVEENAAEGEKAPSKRRRDESADESSDYCTSVFGICVMSLVIRLGWSAYISLIAIYSAEKFGFTSLEVGLLFTLGGVMIMISQGLLFHRIAKRVRLFTIAAFSGMFVLIGMLCLVGSARSEGGLVILLVGIFIIYFGNTLLSPCIPTLLSNFAGAHEVGKVMSYGQIVNTSVNIVGPVMYGALYDISPETAFLTAASSALLGICIAIALRVTVEMPMKSDVVMSLLQKMKVSKEEEEGWPELDEEDLGKAKEMGVFIARMLQGRHYLWKDHMDGMKAIISTTFPVVQDPENVIEHTKRLFVSTHDAFLA